MLTEYIKAAMQRAHYDMRDGEGFFGKIDDFQGVWANSDKLEDCRKELQEVLEEWILMRHSRNQKISRAKTPRRKDFLVFCDIKPWNKVLIGLKRGSPDPGY